MHEGESAAGKCSQLVPATTEEKMKRWKYEWKEGKNDGSNQNSNYDLTEWFLYAQPIKMAWIREMWGGSGFRWGQMCVGSVRRKDQHIFSSKYRLIVLLISNDSKSKSSFHSSVGPISCSIRCLCVYLRHERFAATNPQLLPLCLMVEASYSNRRADNRLKRSMAKKGKRHRMFPSNNNRRRKSSSSRSTRRDFIFFYIFNRKRSL